MSYVKDALVDGEAVLYRGRFHWLQKVNALILSVVLIGLISIIRMWTTEIVLTNRRLIHKRGWIARKTEELSLARIEEVNLRQGIVGRILGYGRVQVRGIGGGDIVLPAIARPMRLKRELQAAQARAERSSI